MAERDQRSARQRALLEQTDASRAMNGRDPTSQKLTRMNAKLGNGAVGDLLNKGGATRDELLKFIHTRLSTIRELQLRELEITDNRSQRDWWRQAGDNHKEDHNKPEPTRWRGTARMYAEALTQLCNGHLDRGAQILERAVTEEERIAEEMGKTVDTTNVENLEVEAPSELGDIAPNEACGATAIPAETEQLAHQIEAVTTEVKDAPGRKRKRDPWWTIDEDEEEEQPDGAAGP